MIDEFQDTHIKLSIVYRNVSVYFCLCIFKGRPFSTQKVYLSQKANRKCTVLGKFSQFSSVAQLCQTLCDPMNRSTQASLSITNSWSLLKLMPIESVMPSSHLILCYCLLLLPPIPPSIRVFSSESALSIRWPKYWSFSFSISPSNEHPGLISFRMDWLGKLDPFNFHYLQPQLMVCMHVCVHV